MDQLVEWQPHRLRLTAEELGELLTLVKRGARGDAKVIEALLPTPDDGVYELVPGPFVGRFALGSGRVLDIRSRLIGAEEVADVLRIAGHLPARLTEAATPAEAGWGIVDVIALALAASAEKIIGHGLTKAYHERRFRSPPLPGTIDTREHLSRHAARPDRLVTVARRLTSDIDRNQAIAAATTTLLRLPLRPLARLRLRRVAAALSSVSVPAVSPRSVELLLGHRRQARYDGVLRLCALVLGGGTIAASGDQVSGASVLFPMTRVWEDFVGAWVRHGHPGARTVNQYGFPLVSGQSTLTVSADVVVLDRADAPVELFDAKYKAVSEMPSAGDIYQMVTYCERLRLDRATLVYPGIGEPTEVSVGNCRIRTVRLSLADLEPS